MPVPTFHISISGNVVAAYGAVVATLTGAVQIINFLRDRRNIMLSVNHHMVLIGDPRYSSDLKLTRVRVVNAGRRPVTITTIGAFGLHPHNAFVFTDTRPVLPLELTEGKQVIALADLRDVDLNTVDSWEAYDTLGNVYRLPAASRRKRLVSWWKWKREWRSKRNEKTPPVSRRGAGA